MFFCFAEFPDLTFFPRPFEPIPPKVFSLSTEVEVSDQSGSTAVRERWPTLEGDMKTASAPVRKVPRIVSLALIMTLAFSAHAQQATSDATTQADADQQLQQRIKELEIKVKRLEDKPATPAPAPPPAPEPQPTIDAPVVNEVATRLKLNVFGDVGYQFYNHIPNTFEFGSLDLFMTARLSDKVSALGEVLFIAQSGNSMARR